MNQDLYLAKSILAAENCTCVLSRGTEVYKSHRRGVAPLMGWLEEGLDLEGFSAADKVVGKATALLYCLLQVRTVYALVMSEAAANVLQRNGIPYQCEKLVPAIQNRAGDGLCPMEMATRNIDDPADAPAAIRAALARLTNIKQQTIITAAKKEAMTISASAKSESFWHK